MAFCNAAACWFKVCCSGATAEFNVCCAVAVGVLCSGTVACQLQAVCGAAACQVMVQFSNAIPQGEQATTTL